MCIFPSMNVVGLVRSVMLATLLVHTSHATRHRSRPPPHASPPRRRQVLSVGGNDARMRFLNSFSPDVITELMITDGFVANLRRVVETIRAEITPNIIIVYV